VANKVTAIQQLTKERGYDLSKICYTGNDLNDYRVMQLCNITACPSDSHPKIKQLASINLKAQGGHGVVRELLEDVFNIDLITILYPE